MAKHQPTRKFVIVAHGQAQGCAVQVNTAEREYELLVECGVLCVADHTRGVLLLLVWEDSDLVGERWFEVDAIQR